MPWELLAFCLDGHVSEAGLNLVNDYSYWMIIKQRSAGHPVQRLVVSERDWEASDRQLGGPPLIPFPTHITHPHPHTHMHTLFKFVSMENDERCTDSPCQLAVWECVLLCVCVPVHWKQCVRVGLVNGRGREDTCSIIRPDKEGQAEGGEEGGWWSIQCVTAFHYGSLLLRAGNQYHYINENILWQNIMKLICNATSCANKTKQSLIVFCLQFALANYFGLALQLMIISFSVNYLVCKMLKNTHHTFTKQFCFFLVLPSAVQNLKIFILQSYQAQLTTIETHELRNVCFGG